MTIDPNETKELMDLYKEVKTSGITSVSPRELERFAELFSLTLPRSDDSVVRVEQL